MLDENLPAFFLKPSTTGVPHHSSIHLSHHGSSPEPLYSLQHLDPASPSPAHKNCYAAALFDAYMPEVLFGEVIARPNWTQATLSQEEIRKNGGVPPPPQAQVPSDFTVQLYNPDQQVTVHLKEGKWGAADTYDFALPETTFRTPSASNLDRGNSDPSTLETTPKVLFSWRREQRLGKDLTCFMTGKSTDTEKKRSRRDPDIAVALWRSMREMTLYESNLSRIDIEDPKGLEVSLLLSAIAIKDLYFSNKERIPEIFNISDTGVRKLSSGGRKVSNPAPTQAGLNPLVAPPLAQQRPLHANDPQRGPPLRLSTPPSQHQPSSAAPQPSPPDPRANWEIEAESARLRAASEAEAQVAQRRRREQEKAAEAERKRLQKMVEQEQKEARRRADEVERETQRLRRIYGVEGQGLRPEANTSQQRNLDNGRRSFQGSLQNAQSPPMPSRPRPVSAQRPSQQQQQQQQQQQLGSNGLPYGNTAASASSFTMSGANPSAGASLDAPGAWLQAKKKKSFFGLRSASDESSVADQRGRLSKKQSTMW